MPRQASHLRSAGPAVEYSGVTKSSYTADGASVSAGLPALLVGVAAVAGPQQEPVLHLGRQHDVARADLGEQVSPRLRVPARDQLVAEALDERVVGQVAVALGVMARCRAPWDRQRVP